jgi:hypothetical protein
MKWERSELRRSCITIAILDIIRRPVFYLNHYISDTKFSIRLQIKPTQKGSIERASLCLRTSQVLP